MSIFLIMVLFSFSVFADDSDPVRNCLFKMNVIITHENDLFSFENYSLHFNEYIPKLRSAYLSGELSKEEMAHIHAFFVTWTPLMRKVTDSTLLRTRRLKDRLAVDLGIRGATPTFLLVDFAEIILLNRDFIQLIINLTNGGQRVQGPNKELATHLKSWITVESNDYIIEAPYIDEFRLTPWSQFDFESV